MASSVVTSIQAAVRAALGAHEPIVLAVSGGVDSMVLLDAAARAVPAERLCVACFDHGTGDFATQAVRHVARQAQARGIPFTAARSERPLRGEAALREARWAFLRSAGGGGAMVCTAHTRDDQIETVLMRILRGAGARGIAALYAASPVVRPLLGVCRADVVRYAGARRISWVEDPSNNNNEYLRNRVRRDLLPALRGVSADIDDDLLDVARRAAGWRSEVERYLDEAIRPALQPAAGRALDVEVERLAGHSERELAMLWPALAARAGVSLDRRGTVRAAHFSAAASVGARMPLSGGWEIVRARTSFQLCATSYSPPDEAPLAAEGATRWGDWSFQRGGQPGAENGAWGALLPNGPLSVRPWRAGDAMPGRSGRPRKIKRLLSKAGITGHERRSWPVVLSGQDIVWLPGVCRSDATATRSGRPGLPFVCEYNRR